MNILIIIIVATLVVAAVAAGIYVVIFRAKHKKEVMENSQAMGGDIPVYGPQSSQAPQAQPQGIFDNSQGMAQAPSQPTNPLMNDITGGQSQNTFMDQQPQVSETPQPPVQEVPSFDASQPEAPAADIGFSEPQPEVQANDDTQEQAAPVNTLDLNQVGPDSGVMGNILDDTQDVGPVVEMAENPTTDTTVDSGVSDFTVPVTKDEDIPSPQPENDVVSQEPVVQSEEPIVAPQPPEASSTVQDFPTDQPVVPQPESDIPTPEVPEVQETAPTEVPLADIPPMPEPPQAPQMPQAENPAAEAGSGEDSADTKEMPI